MGRYTLPQSERIRLSSEYEQIRKTGRRIHARYFIINYRVRDEGGLRLGMAVGKKVGNAVARNRVKRYLREFFRLNKHEIGEWFGIDGRGLDLVIIPKAGAESIGFHELVNDLCSRLRRLADARCGE